MSEGPQHRKELSTRDSLSVARERTIPAPKDGELPSLQTSHPPATASCATTASAFPTTAIQKKGPMWNFTRTAAILDGVVGFTLALLEALSHSNNLESGCGEI